MKKLLLALMCYSGLYAQSSLSLCDWNKNGFGEFDLTMANAEILNGLSANDYTVTYFETSINAQNNVNAIPAEYTNTSAYAQTVYARISKNGSDEVIYKTLDLIVNHLPIADEIDLNIVDNYDDNPSDASLSIPYSVIFAPIEQANPNIELDIKFFSDSALTIPVMNPVEISGGSATFYYTATNTETTCWAVELVQIVVVDGTLSLNDNKLSTLKSYPNPVKDILNIDYEGEIESVSISNSLGQVVGVYNSKSIDLSNFSGGVYFLTVSSLSGAKTIKLIKE